MSPRRRRGAHQLAFAVRAPIRAGRGDELRQALATGPLPFDRLSGVHFARFVVLDEARDLDGRAIPASLLFTSEIDAPESRHLNELAGLGGPGLDATFGLCEGYPPAPAPSERRRFLAGHRLRAQAAYVNTIGRTVEQIRDEARLRTEIEAFLDRRRGTLPGDAQGVRAAVQAFVRSEPSLAWARRRAPAPSLRWRLREHVRFAAIVVALLLGAPVLVPVAAVWLLALRRREARDAVDRRPVDPAHARALGEIEDFSAQNQFAAIGFVKPGRLRRWTVAVVLWLIDVGARHVFRRADLAGVKTIHFARWIVLDDARRAVFTSYYDGSLESYMDDFIDKVAFGLNASFSHGIGYPRTRFLLFEGAKREEEFKAYLRNHQIPSQVWWSAYDDLSARNIEDNALVRSGLFGPMSDADATAWLARL